jgi:hypothetical protein
MTIGTHIPRRLFTGIACGIAVTALVAPTAPAEPFEHRAPASDALDRYVANNRPAFQAPRPMPDALERYVANNRPALAPRPMPDALERYVSADQRREGQVALAAPSTSSDGLGWGDVGMGAAFGLAVSLLGGTTLVLATRSRGRAAHS